MPAPFSLTSMAMVQLLHMFEKDGRQPDLGNRSEFVNGINAVTTTIPGGDLVLREPPSDPNNQSLHHSHANGQDYYFIFGADYGIGGMTESMKLKIIEKNGLNLSETEPLPIDTPIPYGIIRLTPNTNVTIDVNNVIQRLKSAGIVLDTVGKKTGFLKKSTTMQEISPDDLAERLNQDRYRSMSDTNTVGSIITTAHLGEMNGLSVIIRLVARAYHVEGRGIQQPTPVVKKSHEGRWTVGSAIAYDIKGDQYIHLEIALDSPSKDTLTSNPALDLNEFRQWTKKLHSLGVALGANPDTPVL